MENWMLAIVLVFILIDLMFKLDPNLREPIIDTKGLMKYFAPVKCEESENKLSFYLYTRINLDDDQIISINPSNLTESYFNYDLKTYFIIHGGNIDYVRPEIVYNLKKVLLKNEDANVFIVDWKCFSGLNYSEAVNNTVEVGYYLSEFLTVLFNNSLDSHKIHIIGNGLSAHIAGIASYFVNGKVGRITAFNPYQNEIEDLKLHEFWTSLKLDESDQFLKKIVQTHIEKFYNINDNKWKILDKSDAHFVDVIHTNANIHFPGLSQAIGHADFYPNKELGLQPGCKFPEKEDKIICDNERSFEFYMESINGTKVFEAQHCDYALRIGCEDEKPVQMGHKLTKDARGIYYLSTNDERPFAQGRIGPIRTIIKLRY